MRHSSMPGDGSLHASMAGGNFPLSGIRLQCPRCASDIEQLDCHACGFSIVIHDGIAQALPPESIEHHARFMHDYEQIRVAEGRGSESEDFYLALPYQDLSGRNRAQ